MTTRPDPNTVHPIAGYDKEIYVKPTIKNPNIVVLDPYLTATFYVTGHCDTGSFYLV